jgi:uncharacterized membrane protein HdeD (DUF308 family)
MMSMTETESREALREAAGMWWVFLIAGIAWLLLAGIILTPDVSSIGAISTLAGLMLLVGAVNEGVATFTLKEWRWLHGIFAVLFLIGAAYALARPFETFLALAALIGWFLLFAGTFKIITAFMEREVFPLWWVGLIVGILEVLIGFWAAGYPGRSTYLLIIWVGVLALTRGVTQLILAFELHGASKRLGREVPPTTTAA